MQVVIQPKPFLTAFTRACSLKPPPKRASPILLSTRDDGTYQLRSTDHRATRLFIPLRDVATGDMEQILLPREKTIQILSNVVKGPVTLTPMREIKSPKGKRLEPAMTLPADFIRFSCDRLQIDIPWIDPIEYPVSDDAPFPDDCVRVAAIDLARLIEQSIFACDEESTRYALGGVLAELHRGRTDQLRFVGTDGRQMAIASAPCEVKGSGGIPLPTGTAKCVIPAPTLRSILKLLSLCEPDATIDLACRGGFSVVAQCFAWTIESPQVEGRFPNYADSLPFRANAAATLTYPDVGSLLQAVRLAAICTDVDSQAIDFNLESARTPILTAVTPDVGEASVLADGCESDVDNRLAMLLPAAQLVKALSTFPENSSVTLTAIDGKNAVRLEGNGLEYIVMPMTREPVAETPPPKPSRTPKAAGVGA